MISTITYVRMSDVLRIIREGAEVLRDVAPESADIYLEVAAQLEALLPVQEPRADLDKTALLSLCKEHIAQYRAQGMSGKAEAIQVLLGELS